MEALGNAPDSRGNRVFLFFFFFFASRFTGLKQMPEARLFETSLFGIVVLQTTEHGTQ